MPTPADDLPLDIVQADLQARSVTLRLDASLYPLSAVYAAAYVFLDRYFVLLDRPSGGHLHVALAWKKGEPPEGALRAAAGEFANELLSCAWRAKIADDNRAVIEQATAQALAGAMGAPTLDDLESFDFGSEAFDDPLGIAMSWEEKYGKNKKNEDEGKPGDRPPPESP